MQLLLHACDAMVLNRVWGGLLAGSYMYLHEEHDETTLLGVQCAGSQCFHPRSQGTNPLPRAQGQNFGRRESDQENEIPNTSRIVRIVPEVLSTFFFLSQREVSTGALAISAIPVLLSTKLSTPIGVVITRLIPQTSFSQCNCNTPARHPQTMISLHSNLCLSM